jgi:hypothetical protein
LRESRGTSVRAAYQKRGFLGFKVLSNARFLYFSRIIFGSSKCRKIAEHCAVDGWPCQLAQLGFALYPKQPQRWFGLHVHGHSKRRQTPIPFCFLVVQPLIRLQSPVAPDEQTLPREPLSPDSMVGDLSSTSVVSPLLFDPRTTTSEQWCMI